MIQIGRFLNQDKSGDRSKQVEENPRSEWDSLRDVEFGGEPKSEDEKVKEADARHEAIRAQILEGWDNYDEQVAAHTNVQPAGNRIAEGLDGAIAAQKERRQAQENFVDNFRQNLISSLKARDAERVNDRRGKESTQNRPQTEVRSGRGDRWTNNFENTTAGGNGIYGLDEILSEYGTSQRTTSDAARAEFKAAMQKLEERKNHKIEIGSEVEAILDEYKAKNEPAKWVPVGQETSNGKSAENQVASEVAEDMPEEIDTQTERMNLEEEFADLERRIRSLEAQLDEVSAGLGGSIEDSTVERVETKLAEGQAETEEKPVEDVIVDEAKETKDEVAEFDNLEQEEIALRQEAEVVDDEINALKARIQLIGVNVNVSAMRDDVRESMIEYAAKERNLAEMKEAKGIKGIFRRVVGKLFKNAIETKYANEIREGKRELAGDLGADFDARVIANKQYVVSEMLKTLADKNEGQEADTLISKSSFSVNMRVRSLVKSFALADESKFDGSREKMKAHYEKLITDALSTEFEQNDSNMNNMTEVAEQVREFVADAREANDLAKAGERIAMVMHGFEVYNYGARKAPKTAAETAPQTVVETAPQEKAPVTPEAEPKSESESKLEVAPEVPVKTFSAGEALVQQFTDGRIEVIQDKDSFIETIGEEVDGMAEDSVAEIGGRENLEMLIRGGTLAEERELKRQAKYRRQYNFPKDWKKLSRKEWLEELPKGEKGLWQQLSDREKQKILTLSEKVQAHYENLDQYRKWWKGLSDEEKAEIFNLFDQAKDYYYKNTGHRLPWQSYRFIDQMDKNESKAVFDRLKKAEAAEDEKAKKNGNGDNGNQAA